MSSPESVPNSQDTVFICKKGNDSLLAARALRKRIDGGEGDGGRVRDVRGGLVAWAKDVDPDFPLY